MPFTFSAWKVSNANALAAALAFDAHTLLTYDFGAGAPPDAVTTADVGRLIGSHMVGFSQPVAVKLIQDGATAPWHHVPIDARIQDAPPGSPLYVAAMELLDHFQAIRGVKGAIATKLLATKRPALYPVIDDRVREVYAAAPAQFPAATHPFFPAVRRDVLGDGAGPLNGLRAALLANGQPHALRLAQVPGIRLRDIVLWQRYQTVGAPSAGGGAW